MDCPIHVLHVEDNDFFASVAARELESTEERFRVDRVEAADHALERLDSRRYDCVVSDYEMPGMDGLTFLENVRDRRPDIPFILMTGGGSERVASEAISRGVTDYLRKESGIEQFATLSNRIYNAVSRVRAERAIDRQVEVSDLVWSCCQSILEASSREEIDAIICEMVSTSSLYRHAWIGELDAEAKSIVPRATSKGDRLAFETGATPAFSSIERAIHERSVVIVDATERASQEESPAGVHQAVIPLVHAETELGVVVLTGTRQTAFSESERQTLEKFGDAVAYAIDSVQARTELRRRTQRVQVLNRVLRHDLRNDMTVILGYAETLLEQQVPETTHSAVETIRRKALEVTEISGKASIVTETLERAGEGRSPVELCELIRQTIDDYRREYPEGRFTWTGPKEVWADVDTTIGIVLEEVIENAVVHNDHDAPTVHVDVLEQGSEGNEDRLRIEVSDDGPRIPEVEREVLLEGRETALQHSSGLGLWLVNWLVGTFGGTIAFEDNSPRGNVVSIELCCATGEQIPTYR